MIAALLGIAGFLAGVVAMAVVCVAGSAATYRRGVRDGVRSSASVARRALAAGLALELDAIADGLDDAPSIK